MKTQFRPKDPDKMYRYLQICVCFAIGASALSPSVWTDEDLLRWDENAILKQDQKPARGALQVCTDSDTCGRNKIKRLETGEELLGNSGTALEEPILNYFPSVFHKSQNFCSCGRKKRLIDLGVNYFPRYYPDMLCLPGGCGNFACSPKSFKFWVLRRRQEGDPKFGNEPVPLELREHWVAENIVTTVDCECRP